MSDVKTDFIGPKAAQRPKSGGITRFSSLDTEIVPENDRKGFESIPEVEFMTETEDELPNRGVICQPK